MGDCTIHFVVESILLPGSDANKIGINNSGETEFHLIPFSRVLSADDSFVDLLGLLSQMLEINNTRCFHPDQMLSSLCIIDASYHPPRSITSMIRSHLDRSGPRSKTLHSMGWFPSGTVVVLSSCPAGQASVTQNLPETEKDKREEQLLAKFVQWQSRNVLGHEEFGYNLPSSTGKEHGMKIKANPVQYIGLGDIHNNNTCDRNKLKPTNIFNAVQQRFQQDAKSIIQHDETLLVNRKRIQARKEQQRHERIDAILNNLQRSKKKTSVQVRNMLIKSRSTGDKKLRMEDRFHLEIVILDDTGGNANEAEASNGYRFFSRQSTAGKVANVVAPSLGKDRAAEFLVSVAAASVGNKGSEEKSESPKKYRRLPNTMSLHNAHQAGWLHEFDLVLIRLYLLSSDTHCDYAMVGPSKSVLDEESDDKSVHKYVKNDHAREKEDVESENDAGEMVEQSSSIRQAKSATPNSLGEPSEKSEQNNLQHRIQSIFQSIDVSEVNNQVNDKDKAVRKKKPISKQVQNMLMKSKATGNARIKQEDRVYLRLVLFSDDNIKEAQSYCLSSSYMFFSTKNDIGHVIESSDATKLLVNKDEDVAKEFIVQLPKTNNDYSKEEIVFRKLNPSLTLGDAIQKKLLGNFDIVLLRMFDKQAGILSCEEWPGHNSCQLGS